MDYLDKTVMLQGKGVSVEKCFPVERDPGVFAEMIRRGREMSESIKAGEQPPATRGWLCDYCLHREECEE